jgi:carboxylesterase type B
MYILPSLSVLACTFTLVLSAPSATIPAGKIVGTTCANGASAFLSVPFGVPPVGSLRWTAPQPYNSSFPVAGYDASKKGAVCIQFGGEFTETGLTSEDW